MYVYYNNTYSINFGLNSHIDPLDYVGDIVIAMDPSKTNFALVVGTPDGNLIEIVEFTGNNRSKGPVEDTTVYCEEIRRFLKEYLANVNLYLVGIEAAITPHRKGMNGAAFHHSNMVLTEIRAAILSFFMEHYNIKIQEVNNWSWKSHTLPEGYRSMDKKHCKNSKDYFLDYEPDNPLCNYFHEDACDAFMIYKYMVSTMCSNYTLICNQVETKLREYDYFITHNTDLNTEGYKEVMYNNMFSVEENIIFYANRLLVSFYLVVPIDDLTLEQIYNHGWFIGSEIMKETEVCILVDEHTDMD